MPAFVRQHNRFQNSHLVSPAKFVQVTARPAHAEHPLLVQQQAWGNQAMQRLLHSRERQPATSVVTQSIKATSERPPVVVAPKSELETPAFARNAWLTDVLRGKRLLRFGARGEAVRLIQEALISSEVRRASAPGTRLPKFGIDGIFGWETHHAVEDFQREYGLTVDGIVGPQTMYWLDETFKPFPSRPTPSGTQPGQGRPDNIGKRFPDESVGLQPPSSVNMTLTLDQPVEPSVVSTPEIRTHVIIKATFAGTGGKVFFVQNIRRVERKIHWERLSNCTTDCEEARVYLGQAQGLDTSLPYNSLPVVVTAQTQSMSTDDQPRMVADPTFNPQGNFQAGDVVHLFAHDELRMFLAFGPSLPLFDFQHFKSVGFIDWEWKGKARFEFDGTSWSAGPIERRIDPSPAPFFDVNALIFLGPLYTGAEMDRNLSSSRTRINEKPDSW